MRSTAAFCTASRCEAPMAAGVAAGAIAQPDRTAAAAAMKVKPIEDVLLRMLAPDEQGRLKGPLFCGGQHAAAHLVELDALEQRLEVAVAEAVVALALDELEENRAQLVVA